MAAGRVQTLDAPTGPVVDAAVCTGNRGETSHDWPVLSQRVRIRLAYPAGGVDPRLPVNEI